MDILQDLFVCDDDVAELLEAGHLYIHKGLIKHVKVEMTSFEKTPVITDVNIIHLSWVVNEVQKVSERFTINVSHSERFGILRPKSAEMCLKPRTGQHKDKLVGSDLGLVREDYRDVCEGVSDRWRLLVEAGEKLGDAASCSSPVGTHYFGEFNDYIDAIAVLNIIFNLQK